MKNLAKLVVISVFGLGALFTFLSSFDLSGLGSAALAQAGRPTPTPVPRPANVLPNTNTPSNANAANVIPAANVTPPANANANTAPTPSPAAGGKTMRKTFLLDENGSEGAVPFDHETHAFKNYSIDGQSVIACVECHHTDQPKSALKPPLVTSERDVVLTFDVWKASAQKVSDCKACHFIPSELPEGKEIPTMQRRGRSVDLDNEQAYHINCNECHDAAAKLRPALKSKPGFAVGADCKACHSGGN